MEKRKKQVLTATIDHHIRTGEPVGSRYLVQTKGLSVSSATIRQDLNGLEKEGYLTQVHTSSGRVPTDKGYRLYVDVLMQANQLTRQQELTLVQFLEGMQHRVDDVLENISQVVSSLFDYTTIVLTPKIYQETLKVVQFISLDVNRVLVVLLNSVGVNAEVLLEVPYEGNQEDLNKISQYITEKLQGKSVAAFDEALLEHTIVVLPQYKAVLDQLKSQVSQLKYKQSSGHHLLMNGVSKMLKLPEFQDITYTQKVMAT